LNATAKIKIGLVLAAAAFVLVVVFQDNLLNWRAGKAFERIKQGDEERLVRLYLGAPSAAGECPGQLWWNDENRGPNDGRCARWERYDFRGGSWQVGYSADAHVVAKHHDVQAH
jgi:hypothetical protein